MNYLPIVTYKEGDEVLKETRIEAERGREERVRGEGSFKEKTQKYPNLQ